MTTYKAIKKITVTEQIMEQIASLIISGELQPGEKLPPERDLAVRLGVTRGRIREALRALSLVGLVTIKAGEGTFVTRMETPLPAETIIWMFHQEIENLVEVYAARKLIESEVYLSAFERLEAHDYDQLESMLNDFAALAGSASPEQLTDALDQIDLYVGERCGNRIYAKLMQTIVHLRRPTSMKILASPDAAKTAVEGRRNVIRKMKDTNKQAVADALNDFFSTSLRFYQR